MRFLTCLLITLCTPSLLAQTSSYRDNLKMQLEKEDDHKLYLYKRINQEEEPAKLAVVYNQLGLIYQRENNLDSAEVCHRKALVNARKVNLSNQEIGVSLNKVGVIFYYRGELDSAVKYFDHAIPYFSDQKLKANSLNNLALMNKYNSNPDVAISNYLEAGKIYKQLDDTMNQIWVYNNIGALYDQLDEYESGIRYLKKGLRLVENKPQFFEGKYSCLANLGSIYSKQKKYDEAINIFRNNIFHYKETKDYGSVIVNQNNLADCYSGQGEEQKALALYLEVLELMEQTELETHKVGVLTNIASCFENLNKSKEALRYYHNGLKLAVSTDQFIHLETIYSGLSSAHLTLDNADSSIFYKDLQLALRDSLDQVEKEKKMMELESKYRNSELDSELEGARSKIRASEHERSWLAKGFVYAVLIVVLALGFVIFLFIRYKRKKQLAIDLSDRNEKNQDEIFSLTSTLGDKDEQIERLSESVQKGEQKLAYPAQLTPLTEREKQVLEGVKEGLKDQEIADKLFISIATVRTHLRKAYVKIDARNRAEAIQFISKYQI